MKIKEFNMSGAYDHLFKLLIIGDSGEWARLLCVFTHTHSLNFCIHLVYKICFMCVHLFLLLPLPLPLLLLLLLLLSSCIHSFTLSTFPVYRCTVLSHSGISMLLVCVHACVPYSTVSTSIWIYSIHICSFA